MKRLYASLLLLGALLGLFGAEFAYARVVVPPNVAAPKTMTMGADCMAMMAKQQPAPEQKPCKGLTLKCIAAMGCMVPLIVTDLGSAFAVRHVYSRPAFWSGTGVLIGQSLAPDPDPPMAFD